MNENEDKLKSLEILVNATRNKVDYQLNADNGLDAKAGVAIALEVAVVVFYRFFAPIDDNFITIDDSSRLHIGRITRRHIRLSHTKHRARLTFQYWR